MPAFSGPTAGRNVAVKRGTASSEVLIAAVRTKGVAINNEPIDTTNDDDDAWRKLLAEPGMKTVSITCAGVLKDNTLLEESISNTDLVQSTIFEFPGGDKLSGDFFLAAFNANTEHNGPATFEATFESAGVVTFTEGA